MHDMNTDATIEVHPQGVVIELGDGYVSRLLQSKDQARAHVIGLFIHKKIDFGLARDLEEEIKKLELPQTPEDARLAASLN